MVYKNTFSIVKNLDLRFNEKYFSTFGDSVLYTDLCAYCYFVMFESMKNALATYTRIDSVELKSFIGKLTELRYTVYSSFPALETPDRSYFQFQD